MVCRKSLKDRRLPPDDFHAYNNGRTAEVDGGRCCAMVGTPIGGRLMRQQAKHTIFRLAPVVMLVITVGAPRKWF